MVFCFLDVEKGCIESEWVVEAKRLVTSLLCADVFRFFVTRKCRKIQTIDENS